MSSEMELVTNYFSVGDIFTINRGAQTLLAVLADVGSVSKKHHSKRKRADRPELFHELPECQARHA